MGACISRPLLTSLEDLLFSLGSLYSYLYSHLTTLLNRFYSLLLSPLFRVEEHIPSQLCDGTTGVCIRPKDRVKQSRRKVEMRMRRAELAAKGLDPGLALKRKDSRTSNAPEVVAARDNEKIMKRWSRADSIVTTTALDEKSPAVAVAASAPSTTRVRRSTDADRRLRRSIDVAAPHASSTDRPIIKASSVDTAPVALNPPARTRTAPIPGMGSRPSPRTPTTAVAPVPRRVSNANSKPPTAYVALEHAVVPAREAQPTAKLKSRQRLTSLQLEAGGAGEGKLRQTPKATVYAAPKATPAAGTNQAAGVTKGSAGGVGAPLTSSDVARAAEKLVLARQSIDAQRAMPGYITSPPSRTSTPPPQPAFSSLSTTTTHQSQASTGGNGNGNEPSPRGSISDLAAAACNARGNKKERKLWRDEVEKVAKSRVGGSGAVVKG